jgi:hypothetical protein
MWTVVGVGVGPSVGGVTVEFATRTSMPTTMGKSSGMTERHSAPA